MGLFESSCSKCGSKEHATENCPHGIFSSKCSHCGSNNHASSSCPHGIFSSKCSKCGSKDHNSSDCPQGIFSSKCSRCGSKEHNSSNCPHGIFSTKCSKCGSNNHATKDCQQGSLGGLFKSSRSYSGTGANGASGLSGLIAYLLMFAILLALFSSPFKLIDSNFSGFNFKWLDNKDVWIFSTASWLTLAMVLYLLNKVIKQPKDTLEERFSNPYISLPLFTLVTTTFGTTFFAYRFKENYIVFSILVDFLILAIVFLFVRFTEKNKMAIILSISVLTMIFPFVYHECYSERFPVTLESSETSNQTFYVNSNVGANLRVSPSKGANILVTIPNSAGIEFLNDSIYSKNLLWYKVKYNEQVGWISSSLISH